MLSGKSLIDDVNKCNTEKGSLSFWWMGQIGFIVKTGGLVLCFDLFLSEYHDRNIPALIKPEDLTNADYIFGSHDHVDHIDREVWHRLSVSSPRARFVVPDLLADSLSSELNISRDRFIGLDDGKCFENTDIKISAVASAHEFTDRDLVTGKYPYLGFVVESNGCTMYHSGDTCIYEGLLTKLKKWQKPDVMFIPINGRDAKRYINNIIGNMTYQEAADLAGAMQPGLVIPAHYEMFDFNRENPGLFTDYMDVKYPGLKYWIGEHGVRTGYSKHRNDL